MLTIYDKKQQLVPLKLWLPDANLLEEEALRQAFNLTVLPFAYHHVAVMPDAHQGYGMPIGGVLAADGAIIPYAVGLDIGCGMRAAETSIKASDISPERLNLIIKQIAQAIPQGFDWHKHPSRDSIFEELPGEVGILQQEAKNVRYQLGTLGGGNHFIELERGPNDIFWVLIHSGSRNIGKKVAEHFHRRAVKACHERGDQLPTSELSFFYFDSSDGQEYWQAMNWCQKFSRKNREKMMEVILNIIGETPKQMIDIHHNYASIEEHFGKQVLVHRKGAVKAEKGDFGVIPGSMGTHSYIVVGLGEAESFNSSAHGAGRRLGRHQARRTIPVERVFREMEEKGIKVSTASRHELPEECDAAYKNIDQVMEFQQDLVKIVTVLKPMGVVKG